MLKVLITGHTGMLGSKITESLVPLSNVKLIGIARRKATKIEGIEQYKGDLGDINFLNSIKHIQPDIIIHTAAIVDLGFCEKDKLSASKINTKSGEILAKQFPESRFIYISTDSVFDGKSGNYSEDSIVNPLNTYAKTKYEGELAILKNSNSPLIIRVNIYGKKDSGKSLFDWAYNELSNKKSINGFEDVYFNPLYVGQVAEALKTILFSNDEKEIKGVYNLGCKEYISKYQFINIMTDYFNFDSSLVHPIKMKELSNNVERPLNTTLDTNKIKEHLSLEFSIYEGFAELKKSISISSQN